MKGRGGIIGSIVCFLILASGCSRLENTEEYNQDSIGIEQEESRGNRMQNKLTDTTVLGEKQQEGKLFREEFEQFTPYLRDLEQLISIPVEYELQEVQTDIQQNNEAVIRFRYGLISKEVALDAEHYSAVVRVADKKLLGLMAIRREAIVSNPDALPTVEEATDITKAFLENLEPGYFEKLENLWIDRHDEPLYIDGVEQIVSGMKYKCYVPSERGYAWVVIDKNREIMIFERGVHWENNGRTTEKWLYDEYLKDGSSELFAVRKE